MLRIGSMGPEISSSLSLFSTNASSLLLVTRTADFSRASFDPFGRKSQVSGRKSDCPHRYAKRCRHSHLLLVTSLARSPQGATRLRAGMLSVLDHLRSIDKYVFHPGGVLRRFFEGGVIRDRGRIENHHVRVHSLLKQPTMIEPQISRREPAQPANRFRQGDQLFVPAIFAEDAREIPVRARVRIGFQKNSFRRL